MARPDLTTLFVAILSGWSCLWALGWLASWPTWWAVAAVAFFLVTSFLFAWSFLRGEV